MAAAPPANPQVQWVVLNFSGTNTTFPLVLLPGETEHTYYAADQVAVLQGMRNIYAAFGGTVQISLDPAEAQAERAQLQALGYSVASVADIPSAVLASGNYATVYFNSTPLQPGTAVSAVAITDGGNGYTSAPTVTFSAPPTGGTTATGTAVLGSGSNAGQVVSITITNPGSGYSSPPTVTFSGGGDSSAAAATAAITIPSAGGLSSEVDFGNLNLDTTVQVDVNGFLGNGSGQVPDTTADFDNMSTTIASHEIGHTLGLEHMDSFSPIGFGISSPPGAEQVLPRLRRPGRRLRHRRRRHGVAGVGRFHPGGRCRRASPVRRPRRHQSGVHHRRHHGRLQYLRSGGLEFGYPAGDRPRLSRPSRSGGNR